LTLTRTRYTIRLAGSPACGRMPSNMAGPMSNYPRRSCGDERRSVKGLESRASCTSIIRALTAATDGRTNRPPREVRLVLLRKADRRRLGRPSARVVIERTSVATRVDRMGPIEPKTALWWTRPSLKVTARQSFSRGRSRRVCSSTGRRPPYKIGRPP